MAGDHSSVDTLSLPAWEDCESAVKRGDATALQTFIYHNEPADTGISGFQTDTEFREQLAAMLAEVRANER